MPILAWKKMKRIKKHNIENALPAWIIDNKGPLPADWLSYVTIRQATENDLHKMEWEGEYKHFRTVFKNAYRSMKGGDTIIWVADFLGTLHLGQVFIQYISSRPELANGYNRAYLYSFRIKPRFRNQGLGTKMMDILEADLIKKGYQYLTLNVAKTNLDAQRLYQHRGFEIVDHEPGEWSYRDHLGNRVSISEPAWRMEKCLY
jgi:GNAT superfamily N-acetyltransferase